MLTRITRYIILAAFTLALLGSCSKDKKSNTDLLTQAAWKVSKEGLDENINGKLDASEQELIDACSADDLISFQASGTGTLSSGTLHCVDGEASSASFTWAWLNNGSKISLTMGSISLNFDVASLTGSEMIWTEDAVNSNSQPTKYYMHFVH